MQFKGKELAVPTYKNVFTAFFRIFGEKTWIDLDILDICRIYVDHLFVPELANSLKMYREKGSVPIVLGIVDDVHNFMRIKDKSTENHNALYSFVLCWSELITPKSVIIGHVAFFKCYFLGISIFASICWKCSSCRSARLGF